MKTRSTPMKKFPTKRQFMLWLERLGNRACGGASCPIATYSGWDVTGVSIRPNPDTPWETAPKWVNLFTEWADSVERPWWGEISAASALTYLKKGQQ